MKTEKESILYQNNWCKIVSKGTIYILKSKGEMYNDQYFQTFESAQKYIGIIPANERYTFITR